MKKFTLLLAFFAFSLQVLMAQTKEITGTVTSAEDGGSIPGVSVSVKGTSMGTITDMNGTYSLRVPESAQTLVFTFVGMASQEVPIGNKTIINVKMANESISVEEVVVTALGISKQRKSLGYAVQDVNGDKINDAKTGNVLSALTGRVAGVNITSSAGVAGASSFINIRGQNSISGNNQPLFVVDGVPIDNSMSYSGNPDDGINNLTNGVAYSNRAIDLNPDDIETVSVLKGGAATALYGLRAGNGVVMITTKKGGGEGKVVLSFSSSIAFDKVNQLPKMQSMYAQGSNGVYGTSTTSSWGPKISDLRFDGATDYPRDRNGHLVLSTDPTARQDLLAHAYDNVGNFFRTGITTNNNLSITGGNKDANFFMSIGNSSNQGIVPRNKFDKTSIKLTGETNLGSKVKVSASTNYIRSGGDRLQQGSNTSGVMLGLLRQTPTFDMNNGHGKDGYKFKDSYEYPDGTPRRYATYDNPNWTVNKNVLTDRVDRFISYASVTYNPFSYLTVNYKLGDDIYFDRRSGHTALMSANIPDGQQEEDHHYNNDLNSDLRITYTKDLITDLTTTVTVGHNMFQSNYQQLYSQGNGFVVPDFYHISNTSSQIVREITQKFRTAAFYADLEFAYKSMLYLGLTGRNEWSTTLPKANNSFFFPSASLGFIFSELPALKENKILSYGKVRASYAEIANHASPYSTQNTFTSATISDGWATGGSFPFNGTAGFSPTNVLANPTIKPESLLSREVGLELKFLQNRINLDFTYYNNQNRDLLISVPIAGSTGYVATYMNAAKMENKGIEITASVIPVRTRDLNWTLTVNFTQNKNKVLSLAEGVTDISLGGFTGSTINVVAGEAYGSMFSTGFYKDAQGNVIINDDPASAGYGYPIKNDITKSLGKIAPDWTMGIGNDLSYKGASLSFLFDIKQGGIMWNGTKSRMIGFGTAKVTENRGQNVTFDGTKGHIDAVSGEIVSTGAKNDIVATYSQYYYSNIGGGASPAQEQFVEKTNWVRLREVTIAYELGKVIKNTFIKQLRVYATGRNLWLDTPYDGIDPETNLFGADNTQGLDYFNMPNTKSYVFGVKLDF
ncbi:MAG TPA: SusC/RagA family TonB-linked outer membrane protein [Prolixibacteraceae bacterium]|jgi:TonB-linked SusC/RagA family outer membrane protein